MNEPVRWELWLGDELVATIADAHGYDFPWTYGRILDAPNLGRYRVYFGDDRDWPDHDPAFDSLLDEITARGGFVLRDLVTRAEHWEPLINHDGDVVWFRIG